MESFTISELPPNATRAQINDYKRIRLSGLYTNPEAFGSTYARECMFTPETWFDRVNGQARRIIFATPTHLDISKTRNKPTYPGWNSSDEETSNEPWMGTICILWPEMIKAIPPVDPYPPELASREEKDEVEVYMIVGMWVHPDSRRMGVGKALVERAIQVVYSLGTGDKERQKVVVLKVHTGNVAASSLYRSAGFVTAGSVDESGEKWMVCGL
ncbi:hypothetical protein BJ165DRAFT_1525321 [Panaeolus papilionaceus]|nr:hypothetical protein BJ165DRAFT_1525321 [Panaeolus papilionaceus]